MNDFEAINPALSESQQSYGLFVEMLLPSGNIEVFSSAVVLLYLMVTLWRLFQLGESMRVSRASSFHQMYPGLTLIVSGLLLILAVYKIVAFNQNMLPLKANPEYPESISGIIRYVSCRLMREPLLLGFILLLTGMEHIVVSILRNRRSRNDVMSSSPHLE